LLPPWVIKRLYDLNVGTLAVVPGAPAHERPHKLLLLLAALDLLDEGLAIPDRIPWCPQLRARLTARFLLVRKHNDQDNPELPFRYLAGDGFWKPSEADGTTLLRRTPLVADLGRVSARFMDGFEMVNSTPPTTSPSAKTTTGPWITTSPLRVSIFIGRSQASSTLEAPTEKRNFSNSRARPCCFPKMKRSTRMQRG
jgi:hypothetical protein